jgi:hypothetical protein
MILQHGDISRYFTLGELKFTVLSPDEPLGYGVVGDSETLVRVLAIPVESRRPCGKRSYLNLVNHIWDTYLFSFYKYAALFLPSLGRVFYVKDPRAESDWCNRWPFQYVENSTRKSIERRRNDSIALSPGVTAQFVSEGLRP